MSGQPHVAITDEVVGTMGADDGREGMCAKDRLLRCQ